MTTLGMIVRCDQGGLANQTRHIHRCLRPDVTVLIRKTEPRGAETPEWYPDAVHTRDELDSRALAELAACDTTLTVETVYGADAVRARNLRVAAIVNPELFDGREPAKRLGVHTGWLRDSLPSHTALVPYPTPLDEYLPRTPGPRYYHPAAPAMADRNGTGLLLGTLEHTTVPAHLYVRSDDPPMWPGTETRRKIGAWTVEWLQGRTAEPADAYPADCGTLLLPRRYGGMCLPVYEAACLGWDALMLDTPPAAEWPHVRRLVAPSRRRLVRMRGGKIPVENPDQAALARELDAAVAAPQARADAQANALRWAAENGWPAVAGTWQAWLT